MKLNLLTFCLFLSGCAVWPTLTRPNAQFEIRDENNKPVPSAWLKLATVKNPYSREVEIGNFEADSQGKIDIESKRHWETQVYIWPHGVNYYHWNYCASADGYQSTTGQITKNDLPDKLIVVHLTKSKAASTCAESLKNLR